MGNERALKANRHEQIMENHSILALTQNFYVWPKVQNLTPSDFILEEGYDVYHYTVFSC